MFLSYFYMFLCLQFCHWFLITSLVSVFYCCYYMNLDCRDTLQQVKICTYIFIIPIWTSVSYQWYRASFNDHVLSSMLVMPIYQNTLSPSVSLQQTHFFINSHTLSSNAPLHSGTSCLFTVIKLLLIITMFMINKLCLRINILDLTAMYLHCDSLEISRTISEHRTKIIT